MILTATLATPATPKSNCTQRSTKNLMKSIEKKREIAHTSKAIIKREKVMIKGVQKILGLGKYSTHLHILIKVYDLYLL
jgi:hypothetical protein